MPLRVNRLAIFVLPLALAFAAEVRTTDSMTLASFIPACPRSHPEPRVELRYLAESPLEPRPESAPVGVFLRGNQPARQYRQVGEVELFARSRNTSVDELILRASRTAREVGGDALVDVWWSDEGRPKQEVGVRGNFYMRAVVVSWL